LVTLVEPGPAGLAPVPVLVEFAALGQESPTTEAPDA